MVGRLQTDFRRGNLAETLGVLLLKGIAAVAEVNRQEDVGVDAVGTLLRMDEDGNQYAEDSFVVQLKAESVSSIDYDGHALEWLLNQSLPMFIGRVALDRSEISLYPTVFVRQAVMALHAKRVAIRFGESGLQAFLRGQKWSPWRGADDDPEKALVWLGQPLMRWKISDIGNRDWSPQAYRILKKFVRLAVLERQINQNGQSSVLNWSVNDANSIESLPGLSVGVHNGLSEISNRTQSGLLAIAHCAMGIKDGPLSVRLLAAVRAVVSALRECSVEIDSDRQFEMCFQIAKMKLDSEQSQFDASASTDRAP